MANLKKGGETMALMKYKRDDPFRALEALHDEINKLLNLSWGRFPALREEILAPSVDVWEDKDNIYVAFRCYYSTEKPFIDLGGKEDRITLYLDTFNSKREAYCFSVTISGLNDNMQVFNNGKDFVDTWDCVWFYNVRLYNNRYEVEMKIPFKAIRYKKGLNEWEINFRRFIGKNSESDYWSIEKNGLRVSDFGLLKDITPHCSELYIKAYPVGILRYENRLYLGLGGDASWDFLPSAGVSFTFFPDFAQIEGRPI